MAFRTDVHIVDRKPYDKEKDNLPGFINELCEKGWELAGFGSDNEYNSRSMIGACRRSILEQPKE